MWMGVGVDVGVGVDSTYPILSYKLLEFFGSGVLNPGAVFLRFVTVAFLLFLGQFSHPAGQS